jgi:ABC-type polysaccharide/polyol phosphate export permease
MLLPCLFILAMGLAGIAATLAAIASTHGEFFFAFQNIVQVALLTLSTVYYPVEVVSNYLPSILASIATANPLSLAAYALRQYTFAGLPIELGLLGQLVFSAVPFALIGAVTYYWALRRYQIQGKI